MWRAWLGLVGLVWAVACSAPPPPVAAAVAPLEDSCTAICVKNSSCGTLSDGDAQLYRAKCVQACVERGAGDPETARVVRAAMARVATKCEAVSCADFGACYLEALEDHDAKTLTSQR